MCLEFRIQKKCAGCRAFPQLRKRQQAPGAVELQCYPGFGGTETGVKGRGRVFCFMTMDQARVLCII